MDWSGMSDGDLDRLAVELAAERERRARSRVCARCGSRFEGRSDARYCSTRCRVAAHRHPLPAELTSRDRWARHRGKRPLQVDGSAASSTRATTWTSYRSAAASRAGDGLGFMLGDGIGVYDLDLVLDGDTLHPAARRFLDEHPGFYVERSLSGTGLHIWVHAEPGKGWRRTIDGISIEHYTTGRFIALGTEYRP